MPIYLQIDGIKGDATQETHKQWMDIEAIHFNVGRRMSTSAGSAANREASEPTISEVVLTKVSDSSSTKLFQEAVSGSAGKLATIHLVTTGNPGQTYIEYKLTNTLIANYSIDSNGDRPVETVRLNFTKLEVKYTPYDANQSPQSPMIASYDLATTRAA
ncbi:MULTISPECIES: type VI secretion system tube protein Hcp [unclassified Phyllobacterium]|uniref:Hcp family type VI secretion system effector n=2 Tax=Phyllobacteriaceae TaxID=69277 RepID=UPI000DDEE022|nr:MULTISPECIES: type VI secretion system tube protein Hcp [unclassified Phyllobacterium]MBA8903014.1 type VI secretion system secreted protein Hcp [Phyllobacterium sp. P30BS-XVII]MBA8903599.1 type VI secretion system secreted protein Hcp [Phyllobacterium sp. P30BS-XVII]UGX89234.1 type VI secretion system tube protein Hcp [Phyllobacterium sp. T1293]UGX89368.1 type VI secretion system tube protein Hcp [Phyllobacterium sp. T1293]